MTQQENIENSYAEPQSFWKWWFSFKGKKGLSFLRIPLGAVLFVGTVFVAFGNFIGLIDSFRAEPLFAGMLFIIIFPVMVAVSFVGVVLWGGLFYIPYIVFEEEKTGWKNLFKYIGILLAVVFGLMILNFLIFS